jgi:two-component system sensor histidine kinase DesK
VFSVAIPLMELWRIQAFDDSARLAVALVAVGCYLPLHVRHLVYGLRARIAPGGRMTLALMTAIMIVAWALVGVDWVLLLASLVVSILVTLPVRVSLVLAAVVVLSPMAVYGLSSRHGNLELSGSYLSVSLLFRSTCLFVVVWLVAASRRLRDLQSALAEAAVADERQRLQEELRDRLGGRLREIADRAHRADELVRAADSTTTPVVRDMIAASRSTLSEVKRIVDSYQRVSARSELEAAAALLGVAGIDGDAVRAARGRGEYVRPGEGGQ